MRNPRRALCATVLALEAITLGLTTPVMIALADVDRTIALTVGLGLLVLCLLAAGMLRTPAGYWLGHALQVAAVALGFVLTPMFVLGTIFALLWGTSYWLGGKIERERTAAYAAYEQQAGPEESET